jgi:hypothetical protein
VARAQRLASAVALAALLASGCASSVTLTTPPESKQVPSGLSRELRAEPGHLEGPPCFRQEVLRYLEAPGGIRLDGSGAPAELRLSGSLTRIEVHSNRGDKEAVLLYYTAFVITAPLAAIMYGAKDWRADAAADGELVATDTSGAVIWRKAVTVSVSERQRTMPSADALKTAMTAAVCQKLATTLLNGLAEHLAAARPVSGAR